MHADYHSYFAGFLAVYVNYHSNLLLQALFGKMIMNKLNGFTIDICSSKILMDIRRSRNKNITDISSSIIDIRRSITDITRIIMNIRRSITNIRRSIIGIRRSIIDTRRSILYIRRSIRSIIYIRRSITDTCTSKTKVLSWFSPPMSSTVFKC